MLSAVGGLDAPLAREDRRRLFGAPQQARGPQSDRSILAARVSSVCYITFMTSKTAAKPSRDKPRRTTMVPVTTMEEIPVLSEKEHADLLASLKAAAARAKAGKAIDYDSKTFKERLIGITRTRKR